MRKAPILAFLLLPAAAFAAPSEEDQLFDQLRAAGSPEEAHPIEQKLDGLFRVSGSPSVDLLMTRAQAALGGSDDKTARQLLDAVTVVAPSFAEGWRARAQMQAAAGDDAGAMLSLQKAVSLNPRQFEALNDLADMLEQYGDKAGALKLYRQALTLDPQLAGAERRVRALSKEVEGQGILKNTFLAAPFLIGSWFGMGQPDDSGNMWIAHMNANGSFAAQFRTCRKGQALDEVETGRWSLKGDTETITVLNVNGAPIRQDDSYKILSHDGNAQVYRYLGTGYVYRSRRVGNDFVMPSCEAIS